MEVSGRFNFISTFCLGVCGGPYCLIFLVEAGGMLRSQSLSSQWERRGLALGRSLRVFRQGRKQPGTVSSLPFPLEEFVLYPFFDYLFVIYFLLWYWGWYPGLTHARQAPTIESCSPALFLF